MQIPIRSRRYSKRPTVSFVEKRKFFVALRGIKGVPSGQNWWPHAALRRQAAYRPCQSQTSQKSTANKPTTRDQTLSEMDTTNLRPQNCSQPAPKFQGNCIKLGQTHVRLPESGRRTPCGCPLRAIVASELTCDCPVLRAPPWTKKGFLSRPFAPLRGQKRCSSCPFAGYCGVPIKMRLP